MLISRNLPEEAQCDENPQGNRILPEYKVKKVALVQDWTQIAEMVKVKHSHYRPGQALGGSRSLRLLDFKTFGV